MREATIHIPDEALESFGLGEFVAAVRESGLERVTELQCRRPGCLLVVAVEDPVPPDRLSAIDDLAWWERIDGDRPTYLCKLAALELDDDFVPHHRTEVTESDVDPTDEGFDLTMVGAQDALSERVDTYDETMGVLLRSLGQYDGPEDPLDALTDRQREVLTTAFDLGYFSVPRDATTDDVAAELDLGASTVREHLQRAQQNVFCTLLRSE